MPSSVISHSHYDPDTNKLRITFVSGTVYDYLNVPPEVFEEMKKTMSKGVFLNLHIKGKYSFEKVR